MYVYIINNLKEIQNNKGPQSDGGHTVVPIEYKKTNFFVPSRTAAIFFYFDTAACFV
jgi:hypothetical protein